MSDLPLVSILVPAYNHEKYVQECIQSIIDQDYPRIELIVIDDGSKDSTWAKIQEMRKVCERRFERVVMVTQANQGCARTCKRLEELATGEIAGRIASDDKYLPGAISMLVKPLIEEAEVGLAVGINILIDAEGHRCYWDENRKVVYSPDTAIYKTFDDYLIRTTRINFYGLDFGTYASLIVINHIPNGALYKRQVNGHSVFFPDANVLDDWWFHLQLSKHSRYKYINKAAFCYRWHDSNTVRNWQHLKAIIQQTIIQERQKLIADHDLEHEKLFRRAIKWFSLPVGKLRTTIFGRTLQVADHREFDYKQYRLELGHYWLPLSPKLKW